jgi:hypothetical protein
MRSSLQSSVEEMRKPWLFLEYGSDLQARPPVEHRTQPPAFTWAGRHVAGLDEAMASREGAQREPKEREATRRSVLPHAPEPLLPADCSETSCHSACNPNLDIHSCKDGLSISAPETASMDAMSRRCFSERPSR